MGGMIGGAILGALVNKIQGKDWKRGALWGGVTGGVMGSQPFSKMVGGMNPGWMKNLLSKGMNPGGYSTITNLAKYGGPMAAAYLAGDPAYDQRKWEEKLEGQKAADRKKKLAFYSKWFTNPWTGESMYNTGGIVNARPGYYPGGDVATDMQYVDPDLYTPTGEGKGPTSKPIINIPLGPEPSFADEFEDLELASGPGQGDMSGWYEMYEDLKGKGELPDWMDSFEIFMQNLDMLDISPWDFAQADPQTLGRFPLVGGRNADAQTQGRFPFVGGEMAAEGGYKTRPKYAGGGMTDDEKKAYQGLLDSGYTEDEAIKIIELHGSDYGGLQVPEFLKSQAGKAEGGIADLDMTGGGASFGPGTGTSDDIPAMLSDGEFVVTAKAVENLGGGDRMLGARKMYSMMNQLDPNSQTPAEMNTVGIA